MLMQVRKDFTSKKLHRTDRLELMLAEDKAAHSTFWEPQFSFLWLESSHGIQIHKMNEMNEKSKKINGYNSCMSRINLACFNASS